MAVRNFTVLKHDSQAVADFNALALGGQNIPTDQHRVYLVQWAGLLNGDTGNWFVPAAFFSDRSVQVFGTVGVGGSISLEGTNESGTPANPVILTEPFSNTAITFTAAGLKQVGQMAYQLRPHVTAGDGSTNFTFILVMVAPARG